MSMSFASNPGAPDPRVAQFRPVVTAEVWIALAGILDAAPISQTGPIMRHGADLRTEYRAHLEASRLTSHHHAGLEQIVHALAAAGDDAKFHVRNLRTAAGRIVLVSDGADRPVGAVALRKHAA
jgi:hypothetical protein